jgi:hypothetical protein
VVVGNSPTCEKEIGVVEIVGVGWQMFQSREVCRLIGLYGKGPVWAGQGTLLVILAK